MRVYLLWCHGEYGPEDLVATLDQDKVVMLARGMNYDGWFERVGCPNLTNDLEKLLKEKGEEVGIYPLMSEWGGLHLQIVELA